MSAAVPPSAEVTLTDQQQLALGVPDASVALSAGAGCGKTMVLTERFIAALDDNGGRPLEALVALTFTEKAARELRQRIRARCRAKLTAAQDPERWWAVLRGLDAAPIGTFHEFCARLLRRHALQAGVDPEFAILDESIAGSLRDEAVRITLRKLLAALDPDLIDLGADYGLRQVREALGRLASLRTSVDLEDWIQQEPEAIAERWRHLATDRLWPMVLNQVRPPVATCRRLLEALDSEVTRIRDRRDALLEALRLLDPGAPPCPADRLDELVELVRVQGLPRAGSWPSEESYEAIKTVFTELREAIKKQIAPALEGGDADSLLAAADRSLRFARLALAVRREHERLKLHRRGLDFDDLLLKARDLLRDHPELAAPAVDAGESPVGWVQPTGVEAERAVGFTHPTKVEFILVDEFQDTDSIQEEILRLLSGAAFSTGRLFVVGDVKQSIYRFRGAEPMIFREWRSRFPAQGRLSLTENFRSVPGIIGFVNALFGDCFRDLDPAESGRDESSSANDGQRLRPVRNEDIGQQSVEFLWPQFADQDANRPDNNGDGESEPAAPKRSAHERRMIEARCLAGRLRERLEAGWPVFDRVTKNVRPAHPGDVALLFRSMTDLWPYESALADEGFDYHTIGGSAFYAQQEVHDVINLLSVVEDPFDELALAGALRSPFFGVSDEGLFRLATAKEDGGLSAGLYWLDEIAGLSSLDRARASRALELLSRWRADKDRLPMAVLVAQILDESGFEAAVVCEFLGDRKLANTRKIVRLARAFDRQGGFTLAEFVARLRADLENELREEQAATTDEAGASIRLMSIHQAKGLEFPIVVLPDLSRKSPSQSPLVACRPDLGLVVRPPLAVPNPGESAADADARDPVWRAYLALERADDEQESLRLFYVAATRARDALILSAGLEPDEPVKATSIAMRLLDERFDRRTGVCRIAPDPAERGPLPDVRVHRMSPPAPRAEMEAATNASTSAVPSPFPAVPRLSISAIEATISRAGPVRDDPPAQPSAPPHYVDLEPAPGLSPRAARLDGLVRSIVQDPQWRRREPAAPESLAARVGARQVPAASPGLIGDAVGRLDAMRDLPAFQALRTAASGRDAAVRHDLEFTFTPDNVDPDRPDGRLATVFHGTGDLAFRDREGGWNLIVVADVGTCPARQRLRLQLAARAACGRGLDPIARGWLVRHGPDGAAHDELVTDFGDEAIARAIAEMSP
jgi:ATP-dependent helicase/nuclease subunit A